MMMEGKGDMALPSDRAGGLRPEPAAQSQPSALIPSAQSLITKPFRVDGNLVTSRMIADAIDLLANLPDGIRARQLSSAIFPDGEPFRYARVAALDRLFQRWRKLDLFAFQQGRWWIRPGAWEKMQAQAIEARRAETQGGSVHESAVRQDAPHPNQDTPHE